MKTLKLTTAFYTQEFTETPEFTVLVFDEQTIERIKHLQLIAAKENVSIRMRFEADEYLDDDHLITEWKPGYSCIQIYPGGTLYYHSQNKYDSSDQYETEGFDIDRINNIQFETEV